MKPPVCPILERCVANAAVLLVSATLALSAAAQALPDKAVVLEAMQRANAYFVAKWPDPGTPIVTDRSRPSNIWTRGTYYEGALALYRINRSAAIRDYAVAWGTAHSWNFSGGTATRNADNQCAGQTYLELYEIDPQPPRIANVRTSLLAMVNSTKRDDWWWIDALHMAMPVFARLGVIDSDTRYAQTMYELFDDTRTRRGLFNTTEHLWWRDETFKPPYKTSGGKNCYWSRGNGWVYAALVRTLDILPASDPHRAEYERIFTEMSAALLPLQRSDGFWNPSLNDPSHYGGKETSGTAMFTYGMAWGIRQGRLPADSYLPAVTRAWNAMVADALHADGALGWVQGTGSSPADGQPLSYDKMPNFEDYGLGCFLLAGAEVYRLIEQPPSSSSVTAGHNISFSAPSSLLPASWRWQVSSNGGVTWTSLSDNATYSGTTTRTLAISSATSAMDGYKYRYVATTGVGAVSGSVQTLEVAPAVLSKPVSLAVAASGVLFVSDENNHTVGRITTTGAFSVFVGSSGSLGSADGSGSNARFRSPGGLDLDASGNLYLADTGNSTIRKITPSAVVTTFAGSASQSGALNGVGAAARFASPRDLTLGSAGMIYVADTGNHVIRAIDANGTVSTLVGSVGAAGHDDGAGTGARFNSPAGITILHAAGQLAISDTVNNTLRRLSSPAEVTTLAGTWGVAGSGDGGGATAAFSGPTGSDADLNGNLYVADTQNSTIRKITTSGSVTTLAGLPGVAGLQDGVADAMFNQPRDVAVDSSGAILYVADTGNAAIRKINLTTGAVTTLALSADSSSSSSSSSSSGGSSQPPATTGGKGGAPSLVYLGALCFCAVLRRLAARGNGGAPQPWLWSKQ